MKWVVSCLVLFELLCYISGLGPLDDPYLILGVKKTATVQELRKAYKQLAKEWHPDKNNDPAAANKFVEITQAYELLTDPDRRKQFDNQGVINPDSRVRRDFHFQEFDPFDDMFNFHSGFKFTAHRDPDISLFHKLSVTSRGFENNLLPKSMHTPHLVFFYHDWCFSCLKIEPIWRRVMEELEPIGVEIATVHSENEQMLVRRCGVSSVPSLVLLIEGKIYLYKDSFSVPKIVHYVRSKFPYKLLSQVNDNNSGAFLSGWHDNRVRALIFEKTETPRLRYLLMAFYYRERVCFGFVHLDAKDTIETQRKYKVSAEFDTLLLFNENTGRPVASLSMAVIPVQTMRDVITANKYLILPRLSSQQMLDSVCPVEWARPRKRLCVVLVSENIQDHDEPRKMMRQFAQDATYNSERVRFSYIYQEKQQEFVKSLSTGSPDETVLNVVVLWRRDTYHVKYEWMRGGWSKDSEQQGWNQTKQRLEGTIAKLLRQDQTLTYEAVVQELIDEHAQGLMGKMLNRLLVAADFLKDNVGSEHVLAAVSVIGTIAFIVVGGYVMAYLVRLEEEKIQACQSEEDSKNGSKTNGTLGYTPQLKLHELRAEKYNGMVRLLKPGCRTIVLLFDNKSRNTLLPEFHKIVWPYRKNKTLMFGIMSIDRGIDWYKRLLTLSLPEPRELNINPRNCIGTVLSLNGHRRYFCMYHAKHPESFKGRGSKRMMKMTQTLSGGDSKNDKIGGFMGFEDSSDSDSDVDIEAGTNAPVASPEENDKYSNVLFQGNLLDGLANWLDRLFEGTTHRYYINYWPDFPTK